MNIPQVISTNMEAKPRCNYCGMVTISVRVHGHEQCVNCGTNVEPCCEGAEYDIREIE